MNRFLNMFRWRRDRLERDLVRELRYHVDRRADDLIRDGLSEPAARRQAALELGGVPQVQEAVRDAWIWRWLDALIRDVRYAVRSLSRAPGFAVGASGVLALAIGANIAIFSVVSTVLLQPLPYPDADRLVSIETFFTNTGQSSPLVSSPDFLDWQAQNDVFEKMAASHGGTDWAAMVGSRALFANPQFVSTDFFGVFGQAPAAGRLLTADDFPVGDADPTSAVAAYRWAVANFGSAEAAIGKTFLLDGNRKAIVGVAAPGFQFPGNVDFWIPAAISPRAQRNDHAYQAVGKLKPDVPLASAAAAMRTIGDNLAQQHPENRVKTVSLMTLEERLTGGTQGTLWMLMSSVGVLWLIACANIANLMLARAAGRTREIALRAALGAGRGRVVRQLLTESCVLAGVAGLAGLWLASLLVQGLVAFSPADLPRIDDVRIDATALLFAVGLSLISTAFFGLVPALHASRLDLSDALKQSGSKATASATNSTFRSALIVAEVACSVLLLVTAGLLVRSLQALQHVDLGFTTGRVLAAYTAYQVADGKAPDRLRFHAEVLDRVRAVPGVDAAAGVAYLGMGWEPRTLRDVFIEGNAEGRPGERPQGEFHAVTEDYFKTLEIPILAGRDFALTDRPESRRVAIINQSLARTAFPGRSPLGHSIRTVNNRTPPYEIIGVVGDTRWQDPSRPAPPAIYASSTQGIGNEPAILVRSSIDHASLVRTIQRILNEVNPAVPVRFATLDEMFDSTLAYPRFRTRVIGLFAALATVLAAAGIFSVLAYLVGQRTRELALRRAIGAGAGDVIGLIARQGLRLVAIGLILGLAGALAAAQLLRGLLYDISPWDAGTYLGTIAVLGLAAVIAALVPAIRAASIAPAIVLQQD